MSSQRPCGPSHSSRWDPGAQTRHRSLAQGHRAGNGRAPEPWAVFSALPSGEVSWGLGHQAPGGGTVWSAGTEDPGQFALGWPRRGRGLPGCSPGTCAKGAEDARRPTPHPLPGLRRHPVLGAGCHLKGQGREQVWAPHPLPRMALTPPFSASPSLGLAEPWAGSKVSCGFPLPAPPGLGYGIADPPSPGSRKELGVRVGVSGWAFRSKESDSSRTRGLELRPDTRAGQAGSLCSPSPGGVQSRGLRRDCGAQHGPAHPGLQAAPG